MLSPLYIALAVLLVGIGSAIRVFREFERGVVFRLGRLIEPKQPGIRLIIPIIDQVQKVDIRTVAMDVPSQDVITCDNVSVKVNAVVYFRVMDPVRAVVEVIDYLFATSQLAQTTLRSVCGQRDLDDLLSERDKVNEQLQTYLDAQTDTWGIKVVSVEVKHIDLPQEMQRAMARQAEAERDRRAKVINAEGEFQAAKRLAEASAIIRQHPIALQLRYLQTLSELATENTSTTIFPLPVDVLRPFMSGLEPKKGKTTPGGSQEAAKLGEALASGETAGVASGESEPEKD